MKKMSWIDFCNEFCSKDYIYTLTYKDNVYTIGNETQGFVCKKKIYFLSTQHTKNREVVNLEFSSPQLLLNNAKIDGRDLFEIWDDISIDQSFQN